MGLGAIMYAGDADDRFMICSYNNSIDANPANPDSVPQLMMYPYTKNEKIMTDPMSPVSDRDRIYVEQPVNPDNVPYKEAQRLLNWAYKSDWGINWQFISPMGVDASGKLVINSISQTQVAQPSKMLFAIDSVWNTTASGTPYGGGNVMLDPPCVFNPVKGDTRPGAPWPSYYWYGGWNPNTPKAWNAFGGAYPYHNGGRTCVISYVDGHAQAKSITSIAEGCDVKPGWDGYITDGSKYIWTSND